MHYKALCVAVCIKVCTNIGIVTQLPVVLLWVFSLECHLYMRMLIFVEAHMVYAYIAKTVEAQMHKHHLPLTVSEFL